MIFQEPMTALNPVFTIGFQIIETLRTHFEMGPADGAGTRARAAAARRDPEPRDAGSTPTRTSCPAVSGSAR